MKKNFLCAGALGLFFCNAAISTAPEKMDYVVKKQDDLRQGMQNVGENQKQLDKNQKNPEKAVVAATQKGQELIEFLAHNTVATREEQAQQRQVLSNIAKQNEGMGELLDSLSTGQGETQRSVENLEKSVVKTESLLDRFLTALHLIDDKGVMERARIEQEVSAIKKKVENLARNNADKLLAIRVRGELTEAAVDKLASTIKQAHEAAKDRTEKNNKDTSIFKKEFREKVVSVRSVVCAPVMWLVGLLNVPADFIAKYTINPALELVFDKERFLSCPNSWFGCTQEEVIGRAVLLSIAGGLAGCAGYYTYKKFAQNCLQDPAEPQ